ncbi:MAG: HEAT repeat domain-containing protein [Planctomycetota bacterium]|jgi:HEAT repeat protein
MNETNIRPIIVVSMSLALAGLVSPVQADEVASLIKQLGAWSNDKAKEASDKLAAMGKPVVLEVAKALSSKSRRRGRFAARTLRQMGPDASDAIPALLESLKDTDALTREYAVEALAKMVGQAEQIISALHGVIDDQDEDVRRQAKLAIARLTEALKSPGTIEPAPQPSPESPSTDTAARPISPDSGKSPAAIAAAPSERESVLDELTAIVVVRVALIALVPLGFFLLLYFYREPR